MQHPDEVPIPNFPQALEEDPEIIRLRHELEEERETVKNQLRGQNHGVMGYAQKVLLPQASNSESSEVPEVPECALTLSPNTRQMLA